MRHLEDDLAIFAQLIERHAHLKVKEFTEKFDTEYGDLNDSAKKTIQNHRTEMATLLGLILIDEDERVEPSRRVQQLNKTQDFTFFFKTFCHKFQFPNCINKSQETIKHIQHGVRFKPAAFILHMMREGVAKFGNSFSVSGNEVSNLVFNDLRVTTGQRTHSQVLKELIHLRESGVQFEGGSKISQHGREFLGYMTLAGLLKAEDNESHFSLNLQESDSIDYIQSSHEFFEIPQNYVDSTVVRKEMKKEWITWFDTVSEEEERAFSATAASLQTIVEKAESAEEVPAYATPVEGSLKDIGDLGEMAVLKYERAKVAKVRPDKASLVRRVSNDTSLGFDIQSFDCDDIDVRKLIEVKTTKRIFVPSNEKIISFFPMSSNEWAAAKNYKDNYYIYRVFLTSSETRIFIVKNPVQKEAEGTVFKEPLEFRVFLKEGSGTFADLSDV
jgi:hypothetical protein